MRWTRAASGAHTQWRGRLERPVSYQQARRRTKDAQAYGQKSAVWHARCGCQVRRRFASPSTTGYCTRSVNSPMTLIKTNSSPRRARHKPLKPLCAGMPGDFRCDRGDYRVLSTIAHGLRVHRAPGIFPRPLFFWAEIPAATQALRAAGMQNCVWKHTVIASEVEQSIPRRKGRVDCLVARASQ